MGGIGSGRWPTYSGTTGNALNLPVRAVRALLDGDNLAARFRWTNGLALTATAAPAYFLPTRREVRLAWKDWDAAADAWVDRTQTLTLTARSQPFGGVRWWWRCGGCARPRADLYQLHGSPWACRTCLRLTYASRRECAYRRSRRRLDRVGQRLGLAPGEADDWGGDCPDRPARMRWWTYERLSDAWYTAQVQGLGAFLGDMRRVGVPVDDLWGLTK